MFLQYIITGKLLHLYNRNRVFYCIAIWHHNLHRYRIPLFCATQIQYARLWKIHPISAIFLLYMFQADCKIVFNHSDHHSRIVCTLTFYMVNPICNQQMGICDYPAVLCLMFISLLYDFNILRIGSAKNFIDQRHCQLRHLFQHSPEHIIKNSTAFHKTFLSLCNLYYQLSGFVLCILRNVISLYILFRKLPESLSSVEMVLVFVFPPYHVK